MDPTLREAWLDRADEAWTVLEDRSVLPSGLRRRRLGTWLDQQLEAVEDELWARRFAEACPVPGLGPDAYQHRILRGDVSRESSLLVGIRFKGGEDWPRFVELLAWDRPLEGPAAWRRVCQRLAQEFAAFEPSFVRVRLPGSTPPPLPSEALEVDQWVLAGRLDHMVARPRPWGEGSVDLRLSRDLSWHARFLEEFATWRRSVGARGSEVHPASLSELEACLAEGAVVEARLGDRFAGVMAAKRADHPALDGYAVQELFLGQGLRGRRKAPVMQRFLAEVLRDQGRDCLWGTIHRTNRPSLRTAMRSGRRVLETWWFLRLAR